MTTALQVKDDLTTTSLGNILAQSGYFKDARSAGQAIVKVLAGRELGLPPVTSMTGIYIVEGKVSLSANLMGAIVKRYAGGKYNYRVESLSTEACSIVFYEGKTKIGVSTFTMEDAAKAGLAGRNVWKSYPRNMLFARAMSNGARWYCADAFGGPIYTPEELGAKVDGETGEAIDVQPPEGSVAEEIVDAAYEEKVAPADVKEEGYMADPPNAKASKPASEKQIKMIFAKSKKMKFSDNDLRRALADLNLPGHSKEWTMDTIDVLVKFFDSPKEIAMLRSLWDKQDAEAQEVIPDQEGDDAFA